MPGGSGNPPVHLLRLPHRHPRLCRAAPRARILRGSASLNGGKEPGPAFNTVPGEVGDTKGIRFAGGGGYPRFAPTPEPPIWSPPVARASKSGFGAHRKTSKRTPPKLKTLKKINKTSVPTLSPQSSCPRKGGGARPGATRGAARPRPRKRGATAPLRNLSPFPLLPPRSAKIPATSCSALAQ